MGLAYCVSLHSSLWFVVCGRLCVTPVGPGYACGGWREKKCVSSLLGGNSGVLGVCVKMLFCVTEVVPVQSMNVMSKWPCIFTHSNLGMRLRCDRFMHRPLLPSENNSIYPLNKGTNGFSRFGSFRAGKILLSLPEFEPRSLSRPGRGLDPEKYVWQAQYQVSGLSFGYLMTCGFSFFSLLIS